MRTLEFWVGLVAVLVIFADVFSSVLVPRASARPGRVGPLLAAALLPLWTWCADRLRSPRSRQDLRGALGPLLLVITVVVWIAGLAIAFALMLHATPGTAEQSFGDALFAATVALSTLGTVSDETGAARAIVAVAGITGFAILTLTVAFLLSLQSALHCREALVMTFVARAGQPPTAFGLLSGMSGTDDETLAAFFGEWERWTADVMQSHLSYPALLRFRSLDEDAEWLACLGTVLDAAALIGAASPERYPETTRAAAFLLATGGRAVNEFARLLSVPEGQSRAPAGLADALAGIGFVAARPDRFDERLRERWGPCVTLTGIADRLGIAWSGTTG